MFAELAQNVQFGPMVGLVGLTVIPSGEAAGAAAEPEVNFRVASY